MQCKTLGNGIRLMWHEMPHFSTVSVCAFVRCGSIFENKANNGVSHLLEHLHLAVTRGCPDRLQLQQALAEIPGSYAANTAPDHICYHFTTTPEHLGKSGHYLAEILEPRDFPEEVIEEEKRLVLSELTDDRQDYDRKTIETLFGKHPYGLPIVGTRKSVSRLSAAFVNAFGKSAFQPKRMLVVVAGELLGSAFEEFQQHVESIRGKPAEWLEQPEAPCLKLPCIRSNLVPCVARQGGFVLGFAATGALPPSRRVAYSLLYHALHARFVPLYNNLRYATANMYYFLPEFDQFPECRLYYVSGHAPLRHRNTVVEYILEHLKKAAVGEGVETWFEKARRSFRFQQVRLLNDPDYLPYRTGAEQITAEKETPMTIGDFIRELDALTVSDLVQAASDLVDGNKLFLFFSPRFRRFEKGRLKAIVRESLGRGSSAS